MILNNKVLVRNIFIFIFTLAIPIWINRTFLHISPEIIKEWVLSWGLLAPIVFLILFTLRGFVLLPSPIFAIASGLSFGLWYGLLLTYIGTNLSAIATFFVIRGVGRFFRKKNLNDQRFSLIKKQINEQGFIYILILRLLPVVNFDLVSYAAAFSSAKFTHYLFATLIGVIPGTIIYTLIGCSVHLGTTHTLIISAAALVVLTLLPILFRKQIKNLVKN